jgi:hypothetical protein
MDISSISKALELGRQKIDKEIQVLYELARKLKTRRNTLAYISRLPTEIIAGIFTTLARSPSLNYGSLSWIRSATAVCGHWRAIALECPDLWSIIVCSKPNWVGEMLKRSKMAPLTIKTDDRYRYPTHKQLDAVRLALQHISRITKLRLTLPGDNLVQLMNSIDQPALLLRSLYLSSTDDFYENERMLPETLFVGGGHYLHRLELINCSIPWRSPLLRGLIHFKFNKTYGLAQIAATQLLEVLENMPLLETLDLEGLLPILSRDTNRAVHLSHLTSLRLAFPAPEGARFLNHLSFPASTPLVLHCRLHTANDRDHLTVCDAVSSVWNGNDGSKLLRHLLISTSIPGSTRLLGWTTSERMDEYRPKSTQIDVEFSWPDFDVKADDDVIVDLCNALTLTSLHTLFIYHDVNLSEATWLNAFGHLTSLRSLHFRGSFSCRLLSALSTRLEENDDTGEIFLSGLHDLWLEEVDFKDTSDRTDSFRELQDCLMTRCHWDAELHELYLRQCSYLYSEDVELLKEMVVDVYWDETEVGRKEEGHNFSDENEDSVI